MVVITRAGKRWGKTYLTRKCENPIAELTLKMFLVSPVAHALAVTIVSRTCIRSPLSIMLGGTTTLVESSPTEKADIPPESIHSQTCLLASSEGISTGRAAINVVGLVGWNSPGCPTSGNGAKPTQGKNRDQAAPTFPPMKFQFCRATAV